MESLEFLAQAVAQGLSVWSFYITGACLCREFSVQFLTKLEMYKLVITCGTLFNTES